MSAPRRIVIVNDNASATGGASVVALASARELARRGNEVDLFTAVGPVAPEAQNVERLRVTCLGQPEIVDNPRRLEALVTGIANRRATAAFAKILAPLDPTRTIVHVHLWTKALSPLILHEALERGFPTLITLHDFFITCPNGGFFVHADLSICHRHPLSFDCLLQLRSAELLAQTLAVGAHFFQNQVLKIDRRARLLGVSKHSVEVMRPHLPPGTPVTIVRNPIDTPNLGPAPVEQNETFLFIGRFNPEKGVLLLAEAGRDLATRLVFVGDGDLRKEAEQLCPGATFTGWLRPEQYWNGCGKPGPWFSPLWYETLGLVVVEAASQGVPAIVADGCAATDYVIPNQTGLLFQHGSAESLRARLHELARPGVAGPLGQAAYDWCWANPWTLERHAEDLEKIYDETLGDLQPNAKVATAG